MCGVTGIGHVSMQTEMLNESYATAKVEKAEGIMEIVHMRCGNAVIELIKQPGGSFNRTYRKKK